MMANQWVQEVFNSIEDSGFSITPVKKLSPPTYSIASPKGRKIALITVTDRSDENHFSISVTDPKETDIFEMKSRVPKDHRAARELNDIVSLFRARAVLDKHLPVELFPTDEGLRQWAEGIAAIHLTDKTQNSQAIAPIIEAVLNLDPDVATRSEYLSLHCRAAMIALAHPGSPWPEQVFQTLTDRVGDFAIARAAHIWQKQSWAAGFNERTPELHFQDQRVSFEEISGTEALASPHP